MLFTLLLIVYGIFIFFPIGLLFINSFKEGGLGEQTGWGFGNWITAFTQPAIKSALLNTIGLALTIQAISIVIAVFLAWLLARTDLPGRNFIEFGCWLVFFMPTLPLVQSWILFFDPHIGLVNQFFSKIPFLSWLQFDIFSWHGIVWTHLITGTIAIKVIMLTPAFRNLDSSFEEASRINGAGMFKTFTKVVIPVLLPSILVVLIMGIIRSLEAFEIEMVLGGPKRIDVYSTQVYRLINQTVPEYGAATALASIILLIMLPLILLQQWVSKKGTYVTVSGKFKNQRIRLGKLRWPLFIVFALFILMMTVVPLISLLIGTFMSMYGFFNIENAFTLDNWKRVLERPQFLQSLGNTLILGISMAAVGMLLYSITAYIIVRTKYIARNVLDFVVWIPFTIPGIIIGLGLLWFFLRSSLLQPLYGTLFILFVALFLTTMTTGTQIIKTNLLQLGNELEEASLLSGASWRQTYWKVILPNIAPSIVAVGIFCFTVASKTTSSIVLLTTNETIPLSVLQLMYMLDGNYETSSVVGIIIMLLTIGIVLLFRLFGYKLNVR